MSAEGEADLLRATCEEALRWLAGLGERAALAPERGVLDGGPLPRAGIGSAEALATLWRHAEKRAAATPGPRYFHYVVGGVTPAALAGDWAATALDQVASSASGSPLAVDLERIVTGWLAELVGMGAWTGVLTSGATAANLVGLGAARQWWGERLGVDVGEVGLAGLPPLRVLASGRVHASVEKALAMLGLGRASLERFSARNDGAPDLAALRAACADLDGAPAILVATAGDADAGAFDPIEAFAELAEEFDLWLHVDGAFGLFAGAVPSHAHLVRGVERAHSVATDAHKWLNVPYDSGVAFVREASLAAKTFRQRAHYLPKAAEGDPRRIVPANLVPESSRRARALPLYASLLALGADGYRALFERSIELARALADRVRREPDLELLADPELVVVPFRCAPRAVRKRDLDALNASVAAALDADGRFAVGTTRFKSVVCFRPAIVNWRTAAVDIESFIDAVLAALALSCPEP